MSEIRLHSGDPARPSRAVRLDGRRAWIVSVALALAGISVVVGLVGAPDLISYLVRSADRLALRETALRGREALASVRRRANVLGERLAADELFLARLAILSNVTLPVGFPADSSPSASDSEEVVASLESRMANCEALRRRVAAATRPLPADLDPARVPARSPVEPTASVPVDLFGPRVSPLTHQAEFHTGLTLAAPAGTLVVAPAAGTVVFAGAPPSRSGAAWRRLGTVVILSHDSRTRTVYGHLGKTLVRRGQNVHRGDTIAVVGQSGFASAPRLHYEVRKLVNGRFLPVDPRLYVLDADWITAAEVRSRAEAPTETELPPF